MIVAAVLLGACTQPSKSSGTVAEPGAAAPLSTQPAGLVVTVGSKPEGIAYDPQSGLLAVGVRSPDLVLLLDRDGHLLRSVEVSAAPRHLRFAAPGGPLLVPAERSGELDEVGIPTGEILARVRVGRQPHDAVQASGKYFVTNEFSNTVSVIQGAAVIATLPAPTQPGGIAAAGTVVAVVGVRAHVLEAIDSSSLRELATLPAGAGPTHIVAGVDTFYLVDTGGGAILVLHAQPLELIARITFAGRPYGVAFDVQRKRLWVTLTATNSLAEFAVGGTPPVLIATFASVRQPNSVAVDATSGRVFVTGTTDGVVQILDPPAVSQ